MLATVSEDVATGFGRGHRRVWGRLDPARILLFDRESGARIAPAAA